MIITHTFSDANDDTIKMAHLRHTVQVEINSLGFTGKGSTYKSAVNDVCNKLCTHLVHINSACNALQKPPYANKIKDARKKG